MIVVLAGIVVGMLAMVGFIVVCVVACRLPFWLREIRAEDARNALARALHEENAEPWK